MKRGIVSAIAWLSAATVAAAACAPAAAPSGGTTQPAAPAAPAAQQPAQPAAPANPVDNVVLDKAKPTEIVFWHQNAGGWGELSDKLIAEFNSTNPYGIKVKGEFLENYTKLYQKVMASIQANALPDLAATYESMAAEYHDAKVIVPFDDYIASKKYGLSEEDLKDLVPAYMEATKFAQYEGKRLTFPYTKSALVMFTNAENLKKIGASKPAATWDEFIDHCKKAVATIGNCYALGVDASTADAIVYSMGGEVISKDGRVAWDSPEALKTLKLYEQLAKEKLAYQIQGSDDRADVASGKALYMLRSSTNAFSILPLIKNDTSKIIVSLPPQANPSKPATVLFGGNLSVFKSTPEKQLASWLFIKWWASKEANVKWAFDKNGGYFPLRLSALMDPLGKKFMTEDNPLFGQAFEASKAGRVEPSNRGWQDVRNYIADGVTAVITGKMTAEQAQKEIMEKSRKALAP